MSPVTTRILGVCGGCSSLSLLALHLSCVSPWLFPPVGRCGMIKGSLSLQGGVTGVYCSLVQAGGSGSFHQQSWALQQGPGFHGGNGLRGVHLSGEINKEKWLLAECQSSTLLRSELLLPLQCPLNDAGTAEVSQNLDGWELPAGAARHGMLWRGCHVPQ